MTELTAPVAIVTGAGRGLGRAIAARLARDGYTVVAVDLDAQTAADAVREIAAAGGSCRAVTLDVADRAAVHESFAQIAAELGRIDVVVNNAMRIQYRPIAEMDEETVEAMIGVGLKAAVWTTQAALPSMRAQGAGAIVNVSSPAATMGVPGASIYSAVKGAVASLTRQCAVELAPDGVRVNAVVPGSVPTPGAAAMIGPEGFEARRQRTPLGRLGTPEEIAAAVSFLVSADASFVTGHMLVADGGIAAS